LREYRRTAERGATRHGARATRATPPHEADKRFIQTSRHQAMDRPPQRVRPPRARTLRFTTLTCDRPCTWGWRAEAGRERPDGHATMSIVGGEATRETDSPVLAPDPRASKVIGSGPIVLERTCTQAVADTRGHSLAIFLAVLAAGLSVGSLVSIRHGEARFVPSVTCDGADCSSLGGNAGLWSHAEA
jgi:hypothetical protein